MNLFLPVGSHNERNNNHICKLNLVEGKILFFKGIINVLNVDFMVGIRYKND